MMVEILIRSLSWDWFFPCLEKTVNRDGLPPKKEELKGRDLDKDFVRRKWKLTRDSRGDTSQFFICCIGETPYWRNQTLKSGGVVKETPARRKFKVFGFLLKGGEMDLSVFSLSSHYLYSLTFSCQTPPPSAPIRDRKRSNN